MFRIFILVAFMSAQTCWAQGNDDGYFWHIADFHLDTSYWTNEKFAEQFPDRPLSKFFEDGSYDITTCWLEGGGKFGDYNCDAPAALITSAIDFVQNFKEFNASFVIWTGDDTVHANDVHFNKDIVLDLIQQNTDFIKPLLTSKKMMVFPVLGNHDSYPKNAFPGSTADGDFYKDVGKIWSEFLAPVVDGEVGFGNKGGYYKVDKTRSRLPFHLLAINTNVYYKNNNNVSDSETDPLGQFSWLEATLKEFRTNKEKTIVFGHISPGKFERYYNDDNKADYEGWHWLRPQFNEKLIDLFIQYNDVVIAQFYGHHHTDTFKLYNKKGTDDFAGSPAFLAPGVTPWRSTLSRTTGANNPGLRLVKFNQTTGEIKDIIQYYLDLEEANKKGKAEWKKLYTMTETYQLPNLSLESLAGLANKLKPSNDTSTFKTYYDLNSVKYKEFLEYNCTVECQSTQYCSIIRQRYDEFKDCYMTSSGAATMASIILTIILAWGINLLI